LAFALLTACGGGGSSLSVSGKVYGLLPGVQLWIEDGGSSRLIVTSDRYQADTPRNFTIERGYEPGASYALAIVRQPLNQLCRITRNATGLLSVSQTDVRIDCHRTIINDTGIRSPDLQVNLEPDVALDAMMGRDSESARLTKIGGGVHGFDYSKICTSGDVVTADSGCRAGVHFGESNQWACTRDNVTGLVWKIRSLGEFNPSAVAPPSGYCGVSAWRSPRVRELLSLVHAGKPSFEGAAIDLDFFPDTPAAEFRAAEAYPVGTGSNWAVHFGQRGASSVETVEGPKMQRWVAAPDPSPLADTPSSSYRRVDAVSNRAIVEMPHELAWLVPGSTPGALTWESALASVAAVNQAEVGGYADWRLPNRAELELLVQRGPSASVPALDSKIFGDDAAGFASVFWTASSLPSDPSQAWVIDFRHGDISRAFKTGPGASLAGVIYVRNKGSGPSSQ